MTIMLHRLLRLSAAAILVGSLACGGVHAATQKKAPAETAAPAACRTVHDESACRARTECRWVKASYNKKTKKLRRKAHCRSIPKTLPKKSDTPT